MSPLEAVLVLLAGMAAGAINAVVGSGTLITFPTLIAIGFPPVVANASNTVGLVPGSVTAAVGYREELAGQRGRILRLGAAALAGGTTGAILLLALPESVFETIVPVLIGLGLVLIVLQPRLSTALAARRTRPHPHGSWPLVAGIYATGVYGGYFGAAQGVLLLAIMGIALDDSLQRINAMKNVLAGIVNGVAALVFIAVAEIAWEAVALIAVGSIAGGFLGARFGRRLPAPALRGVILAVGIAAMVYLVVT